MTQSHQTAEAIARESYGRLVAFVASRTRDLATAEDALSQAFLEALAQWPKQGIPDNPQAWLVTVARRRATDETRKQKLITHTLDELALPGMTMNEAHTIPDERLKLMFVCTHPAIDAATQTPLMLQTVLGMNAATMAKAYVLPAATMSQRLVRAKTRIRELAIPFEEPGHEQLPDRLDAVLQAIYAAYTCGWHEHTDMPRRASHMVEEAIHLARLLVLLLPAEPEARGLLALLLHAEARRPARLDTEGRYVPLADQDTNLWDRAMMNEAEEHLWAASTHKRPGRFQLEAAIQSAQNRRARDGITPWADIVRLYRQLLNVRTTLGAEVAYAAALTAAGQLRLGLQVLDEIQDAHVKNYQPYWATRFHLLKLSGRNQDAAIARQRAIELCDDPAMIEYLSRTEA